MDSDYLKQLGMEIVEDAVGVFVAESLGIADKLNMPNDSDVMRTVKGAVVWSIVDEMILLFKTGSSHLIQGNYYIFVDNVFFNSAVWFALEKSGVGERVTENLDTNLPFSGIVNQSISTGILKVGAKTFQNVINNQWYETPLRYLVSVTTLVGLQEPPKSGNIKLSF